MGKGCLPPPQTFTSEKSPILKVRGHRADPSSGRGYATGIRERPPDLPALVAGGAEVSEAEAQHKPQASRPSFSPASLSQAIPRVRDVGVFICIDFAVSVLLDGTSMSSLKEANSSLEIGMIPDEFKNEPTCTT